jgi:pyrimidine deaminase RibD-like protein
MAANIKGRGAVSEDSIQMSPYLRLALKLAYRTTTNRHRVGAVIVKGGKILGMAHNMGTKHAEERALCAPWRSEVVGATAYVARPLYNKRMQVGLARPCEKCLQALRDAGITKIVYTVQGSWDWERI